MTTQPLDVVRSRLAGTNLIEASAGTGKTWAICGLYLRLLLERRLEVQQILVVTFTKTATAELRERIRSRIAQTLTRLRGAAEADPFIDALLPALREQHALSDADMVLRLDLALQTFDEASIFTIHGFCQRALADAQFSAGMPQAHELLADDAELRLQAANDFWRRHLAGDAVAPALAGWLLEKKDSPERWSALVKRALAKPLARNLWPADDDAAIDFSALATAYQVARSTWRAERERIIAIVSAARPQLRAGSYKPESIAAAAQSWDALLEAGDLLAPGKFDKADLFTATQLRPNNGQPPVPRHDFFAQADTLLGLRHSARRLLAVQRLRLLRQLLAEAPAQLRVTKRERRVVAFDDMLYNLYQRLQDSAPLAAALKARFAAALIDEFQDTDPLQLAIFRAIYGGGDSPLFLVGDPKQAIYSFRNADLHSYLRARRDAAARYTLTDNQRSSRELLVAQNGLFAANPRAFMLPGLEYVEVSFGAKPRLAWLDHTLPRAPLQLWSLPVDARGEPLLLKPDARRAAIGACAGEIARLLAAGQHGEIVHGERALAGGDIAVLVRSHAHGAAMRQALALLGVASVELSQASVFSSPDAEDLERVLLAILEPARDALLRAALSTTMLGFDAAAIDAIADDEARLLQVVTRLAGYREQWLQRGIGVMLRALMAGEGVAQRLLCLPDGERRMTNLMHLGECLHQAAQINAAPQQQLRWLQTQRSGDSADDAAQLRLESDRNLVQVVTVHRAKGLEYPVVFCPLLWDGHPGGAPPQIDGREYHADDGQPVIDFRELGNDVGGKARTAQMAQERAAENLRLVYVALTRAVHRCYLVVGPYSRASGRGVSTAESGRAMIHWLVAGAGRTPEQWLADKTAPATIAAAWQRFAAALPGSVALQPLPDGPWAALPAARIAPDALAALPPPANIPRPWWIGSYSSLTAGARHDGAAADHDARVSAPMDGEPDAPPAADDLLDFPRGAAAGSCMHKVFELADFRDPTTWPAAIAAALNMLPTAAQPELHARMLARMLANVLHAPLPGGLVLSQVPLARRLTELEFSLPAARLRAGALASLLRAHGHPVPALAFERLEGYLRGFIDLVVEQGGRFFIIDWKSNHLGPTSANYARASLARAMQAHGYQLQYLLYAVALHRYLGERMPDYRYDDHFGGAIYLFVRGVRPGWIDAGGAPAGIYADRPPRALIEGLSALFDPVGEPA